MPDQRVVIGDQLWDAVRQARPEEVKGDRRRNAVGWIALKVSPGFGRMAVAAQRVLQSSTFTTAGSSAVLAVAGAIDASTFTQLTGEADRALEMTGFHQMLTIQGWAGNARRT
ncbi:MAG TPA: hypothetical protein VJ754_10150 [Anaerolineae bacterium]|nr:hypothetical protein [Anaerolineae bacterium]